MAISAIRSTLAKGVEQVGSKFQASKVMKNANKFFETDGFNMGSTAFNTLIMTAVVLPRLVQARDNDERREILTRDMTTVLTLLFAMKGINAGLSKLVSNATGLVLTNKPNASGKNVLAKAFDYIRPSGIRAMNDKEIISKYGQITNKESLIKLFEYIKDGGGNIAKTLNIKGDLAKNVKSALGDIKDMGADDIINKVKGMSEESLKGITDILKSPNNPIAKKCKGISGWFQAGALGVIIGFLGFGLPAINKIMTSKAHAKDKNGKQEEKPTETKYFSLSSVMNLKEGEKQAFSKFIG